MLNALLSIIFDLLCQVVAYGRLKAKENIKLLALKLVAVAWKRLQINIDLKAFGILEN